MSEETNNVVQLVQPRPTPPNNIADMSLADLIREEQRLDAYCADPKNDDDNETWDRHDNVLYAIFDRIFNTRAIAITKWGRPILNLKLDPRIERNLSDEDKGLVREYVQAHYEKLCETYEWYLAGALTPRQPLNALDVAKRLRSRGIRVFWDNGGDPDNDENGIAHYCFINPSCTQCIWMETTNGKAGQVDYFRLISNATEMDDNMADMERRLLEIKSGKKAMTGPDIELIPLLQELYGDNLATREEALPLMSPQGFENWMFLYLVDPLLPTPKVVEEAA